jgi:hypothetical protein
MIFRTFNSANVAKAVRQASNIVLFSLIFFINIEIMQYLFNLTGKRKVERDARIIGRPAPLKSPVPEADSGVR